MARILHSFMAMRTQSERCWVEERRAGVDGKTVIVALSGHVDAETYPAVELRLTEILGLQLRHLVLDLHKTTYINSCGWGLVMMLSRRMGERGGALVVASLTPEVGSGFHTLGLPTMIAAYSSVGAALTAITASMPDSAETGV